MKKFKKSLVLAILVAFGLSFCGVFSEGAMAIISTNLEYQGTWKEFNGSTWNEKTGTIHTNITTDYANVSCNGKNHVVVRTYNDKVNDGAEWNEELNLKCGERITPTEYVNGHQQAGKPYYKNVRDIENQLKSNGVGIYDCVGNTVNKNDICVLPITKGDKKAYVIGQEGGKAKVECTHVPTANAVETTYISTELGGGKTYKTSISEGTCDGTVETALKKAGFDVGNWNSGWYKKDDDTTTKKDETKKDDDTQKKDTPTGGGGTKTDTDDDPAATDDDDDPVTPSTWGNMTYNNEGHIDYKNNASILKGCSGADNGEGEGIKCIIELVIDIMTIGVGILSVVGITVVGVQYLSAGGNEERTRKAKHRLFEIVIGVVLYVVAYAALKWLLPSL